MAARPVSQLPVDLAQWIEIEAIHSDDVVIAARHLTVNAEQRVVHLFADNNAGAMAHHYADLRIGTVITAYPVWDSMVGEPADGGGGDDTTLAWLSDAASGDDTTLAYLSDFAAGDGATLAWLSDVPASSGG